MTVVKLENQLPREEEHNITRGEAETKTHGGMNEKMRKEKKKKQRLNRANERKESWIHKERKKKTNIFFRVNRIE